MEVISITPMEKYMLLLLKRGMKDREIATLLNCQTNALQQRLLYLRRKTGCNNRAELVSFYYENIHPKQTQQ